MPQTNHSGSTTQSSPTAQRHAIAIPISTLQATRLTSWIRAGVRRSLCAWWTSKLYHNAHACVHAAGALEFGDPPLHSLHFYSMPCAIHDPAPRHTCAYQSSDFLSICVSIFCPPVLLFCASAWYSCEGGRTHMKVSHAAPDAAITLATKPLMTAGDPNVRSEPEMARATRRSSVFAAGQRTGERGCTGIPAIDAA